MYFKSKQWYYASPSLYKVTHSAMKEWHLLRETIFKYSIFRVHLILKFGLLTRVDFIWCEWPYKRVIAAVKYLIKTGFKIIK